MVLAPKTAQFLVVLLTGAWVATAAADPPAHAPAHGWRKKHEGAYVGHAGAEWDNDYEITSGRCNRDAIGAVVGGVVGGAIANRVADENRAVATIIGAAAGALIGRKIGAELDERDRDCVGHALEIGSAGRMVVWTNEATGVRYELAPGADRVRNGSVCREFTLAAAAHGEQSSRRGLACRSREGQWQVVQ
ncbi:MAG TPA: RT0821/Lpp0805 family surface protein [Gammaproteobacteria bacterium]|nr:RT0821/Lpp0805 family surface protein [Gammaproteobacteria bacterium]